MPPGTGEVCSSDSRTPARCIAHTVSGRLAQVPRGTGTRSTPGACDTARPSTTRGRRARSAKSRSTPSRPPRTSAPSGSPRPAPRRRSSTWKPPCRPRRPRQDLQLAAADGARRPGSRGPSARPSGSARPARRRVRSRGSWRRARGPRRTRPRDRHGAAARRCARATDVHPSRTAPSRSLANPRPKFARRDGERNPAVAGTHLTVESRATGPDLGPLRTAADRPALAGQRFGGVPVDQPARTVELVTVGFPGGQRPRGRRPRPPAGRPAWCRRAAARVARSRATATRQGRCTLAKAPLLPQRRHAAQPLQSAGRRTRVSQE